MSREPSILYINTFPQKYPSRAVGWNYDVTNNSLLLRSFRPNGFPRSHLSGNPCIFSFHHGKPWRKKARHSEDRILSNENFCSKRKLHGQDIQHKGRPWKLSERDERSLLRQINVLRRQKGSLTIKRPVKPWGICYTDTVTSTYKPIEKES